MADEDAQYADAKSVGMWYARGVNSPIPPNEKVTNLLIKNKTNPRKLSGFAPITGPTILMPEK